MTATIRSTLVLVATALATPALAQPGETIVDIEVPTIVLEDGDAALEGADEALDLANIVQSAAKGVTTVQEAPAIVTVVTSDEIRDRQWHDLTQLYDTVPGWSRGSLGYGIYSVPLVRGQGQAVQYLHDSVSLFDPMVNTPSATRPMPMELIKRVELITGPGGVLWGSNSLLGILNVITKDAEDVEGVEMGGELGHGQGDRMAARAYVMAGKSDLLGGKVKAFVHGSVDTFQGQGDKLPMLIFHGALPQPNSANIYGPLVETDQARSMVATLTGKLTLGKLQLRVHAPFGRRYSMAGLSGNPSREDLPEDARCTPDATDPSCHDPRRTSRRNRQDNFDRYAVAEYRDRFAEDKAGLTARAYVMEFVRGFTPLQVLTPSALVQGGLAFQADLASYRAGGAFDGDVEISSKLRLLYGAEGFKEWKPDTVTTSRQGPGTQSEILAPYDLTRLPLLCPRSWDAQAMRLVPIPNCPLTFAFPAERTVFGGYLNPQWRPNKKLILDVGGRLQVAPASLGNISYPVNTTVSGTLVYNFVPSWHLKLNYAQGFRPPVFNNTASNGEGVQIGGNPKLGVETSDAAQAEINARIWKGERRIRELSFRVDGSYTRVNNLIQIKSGNYDSTGERGIASVELLGKLYVQGGHRLELGYTYLRVDTSDRGRLRTVPEHWFNLAGVWNLIDGKLSATSNLKVAGAAEDPNRLVEYRGSTLDAMGEPQMPVTVGPTDLVMDRLPPTAELGFGLLYQPVRQLAVRATVWNALFGHFYHQDVYADYEPHLEYVPNPVEGFRAYVTAMYSY